MSDEIPVKHVSHVSHVSHVCQFCKKEINVNKHENPPTWFGRYEGDWKLLALICHACLSKPELKKQWSFEFKR